ncbi:MAG TPA: TIR domain-containing protein [Chitinophagales bacterium]|nr:TIR domain-containing protein [Chitinophagales bacterium]
MPEQIIKNIFISYAHEDELFKDKLVKHLSGLTRNGEINLWTDTVIVPGQEWDNEIKNALHQADIILFLVSADFMASNYIHTIEIENAIAKHNSGEIIIVPVIIRSCDFRSLPLKKFQALPKGNVPVTKWSDEDEAFLNIVEGIKMILAPTKLNTSPPPVVNIDSPTIAGITTEISKQIRNFIATNKTELAINILMKVIPDNNTDATNTSIVLHAKYNELSKKNRLGIMSYDEYSRSVSGVNIALLELLDTLTNE